MTEVNIDIKAKDRATTVLTHVTKQLGIFNKQGIAMGVGFSAITKGIDLAVQAFNNLIQYLGEGIQKNRDFELSLVRLSNSMREFDTVGIGSLRKDLLSFSIMFAENVNVLTNSLRDFIREGYSAADSLKMLYNAEKLAIANGEDLSQTQNAIVTALQVFGYEAESTGYIVEQLNRLVNITGLGLGELDRLLSSSAGSIHDVNINMDDFVAILYSLEKQGYSSRSMLMKLKDILGDYGKTLDAINKAAGFDIQINSIKNLNDAFKTVSDTAEFTADMLKQVKELSQMELGGKIDIGAYFDKTTFDRALEEVNHLKKAGIETVDAYRNWQQYIQMPVDNLIAALIQFNEEQKKIADESILGYFQRLSIDISNANDVMLSAQKRMQDTQKEISNIAHQKEILTITNNISSNLRYMELGLQDVSYASKIEDSATRALVISLRRQMDVIDGLNKENDKLSLSMNRNSLEMLKLEYSASLHRGRLTRSERKRMKELERANMELRIDTQENEITMDQIKMDMSADEYRLNQIKMFYDEELYTVRNTYNEEMKAMDNRIAELTDAYNADVLIYKSSLQDKYDATKKYYDELRTLEASRGTEYAGDIMKQTGRVINSFPGIPGIPAGNWGRILAGLPLLHDFIITKNGRMYKTDPNDIVMGSKNGGIGRNMNIVVHVDAVLRKEDTPERLQRDLAHAIASGAITGVVSKYRIG